MAYAALRHLKFSVLFNYRYIDFFLPDILINRTGNKKKKKSQKCLPNYWVADVLCQRMSDWNSCKCFVHSRYQRQKKTKLQEKVFEIPGSFAGFLF